MPEYDNNINIANIFIKAASLLVIVYILIKI